MIICFHVNSQFINNVCLDVISDEKLYCNIDYSSSDVFFKISCQGLEARIFLMGNFLYLPFPFQHDILFARWWQSITCFF